MANKRRSVNTPYGLAPSHTVLMRSPFIRAGDLQTQCLLQKYTPVTQPSGNVQDTWTTLDTVWTQIIPLHGAEFYYASQSTDQETIWLRMRYRDDVVINMRFVTPLEQFVVDRLPTNVNYAFTCLMVRCVRRLIDQR